MVDLGLKFAKCVDDVHCFLSFVFCSLVLLRWGLPGGLSTLLEVDWFLGIDADDVFVGLGLGRAGVCPAVEVGQNAVGFDRVVFVTVAHWGGSFLGWIMQPYIGRFRLCARSRAPWRYRAGQCGSAPSSRCDRARP